MRVTRSLALGCLLCGNTFVNAIDLDVNSADSILSASRTIVQHILGIYNQSNIPGLFPKPYYFWESGLAFNALIDYYSASGDEAVLQTIQDGILWQTDAPDNSFMPVNQSKSLGNDDQAFWGLAAITAAETGFPQRDDQNVTWLELAENVFNTQVQRWDTSSCEGGLRWQIYVFSSGYNYKNFASQGSFAELAARLAHYTGNSTYSDWAQKATQWSMDVGLISDSYFVYDGTDSADDCSDANHIQWTQNTGLLLGTAAYAYHATDSPFWNNMITPLLQNTHRIFTKKNDNILYEVACEPIKTCETDQLAYRAKLAQALSKARDLSSADSTDINDMLQASARGAAAQCSGGDDGTTCGSNWSSSKWDGTQGLGQDLSALAVMMANLPAKPMNSANATDAATPGVDGTTTAAQNGTNTDSGPDATHTGSASGFAALFNLRSWGIAGMMACLVLII